MKILETNNYGRFELHEFNRDVRKTRELKASMEKYGWVDAYPMLVVRNGDNKLKIVDGHHRFEVAQSLKVPVKYVEMKSAPKMHELENARNNWTLNDYVTSFVRSDNEPYIQLYEYHEDTGIPLGLCASMLCDNNAASGNYHVKIKSGKFKVIDSRHADMVGDIIKHCVSCGLAWATNNLFVQAISKCSRSKDFNPNVFKQKVTKFHAFLEKQPNLERYMEMIDELYNRQARVKIPLKFLAEQACKERVAAQTRQ